MTRDETLDRLRAHQAAALSVLTRGTAALAQGREAMLAQSAQLRAEMAEALGGYQAFKHEAIFDPALASADPERIAAAQEMKAACIAAGEGYRRHMQRWSADDIRRDWPGYVTAARLTVSRLRRHIGQETDDVRALILRFDA